nr:lysine--tRNA ligase [Nanoarchaeum sp.]
MTEELDIYQKRKEKLNWIIQQGVNPFPYTFDKKDNASEILSKFKKLKDGENTKTNASIAGRVITTRVMGKASFITILDETDKIQIFGSSESLKNYELFKKLDHGDIIGIQGKVFKTKVGEITIHAEKFELLTKSLLPLPDKYKGLKDPEIRYRQRYLDFIANPEQKEIFIKRHKIVQEIRDYTNKLGFIEVETPVLQTVYGGAKAKPFKTHINAWNMDLFLSISPELYLKRLLVGGFEKVYTITKNFRNEGVDRTHNPEFTMFELYWAYKDYNDIMNYVEDLFVHLSKKINGTTEIEYDNKKISLKKPWQKLTMYESLKKYAKIDVEKLSDNEIKKLIKEHKIELPEYNRGWAINYLFEELVESQLIQPTFITDYPKETSPLCKEKRGNPELIERFEFFINGHEFGNAYSELNNPIIQKELLEKQEKERLKGDQEANPMDKDFILALEHGMPPAGGLGIGVDRLVMLLTNSTTVREVIAFPTMKPL